MLWLWRRPVATAPIQPLAREPPYAAGAAQEIATTTTTTTKDKKTKDKEKKRKKESNPIYNCIKKIKYLRLNLTTEVKDLYSENNYGNLFAFLCMETVTNTDIFNMSTVVMN